MAAGRDRVVSVNSSSLNDDETDDDESPLLGSNIATTRSTLTVSTRTIKRNLYILSIAMVIVFTAFSSLQSLQSSLNATAGRGVTCLAVLYGVMIFSSLLLAPVLVGRLRPKRTLVICFFGHCVFTASNFYPQWSTLIPACALLGAASGPLWAAKNTYLTSIAVAYAGAEGIATEEVIQRFNGIFYAIYQGSQIVGNLVSSLIFTLAVGKNSPDLHGNASNASSLVHIPDSAKYTLFSVFEAFAIIAVLLLSCGLKSLQSINVKQLKRQSVLELGLSVFKLHKDVKLLLLVPIAMYAGQHQAFFFAEYTEYYITDVLGIQMVGFVMMVSGVVDSVSSYASGKLSKLTGSCAVILTGGALNLGLIVFLMAWNLPPSRPMIFTVAALWGIVDAIFNTQTSALFGVLFVDKQEAGFGAYRFWRSVGYTLSLSYSSALQHSVQTKMTILLIFLCVSMAGYVVLEIGRRTRKL